MEESLLPEMNLPAGAYGLFLFVTLVLDSSPWEGKSLAKASLTSRRLQLKDRLSPCLSAVKQQAMGNIWK